MALFRYIAVDSSGERVSGELEADTRNTVLDQIQRHGQMAVRIEEAGEAAGSAPRSGFFSTTKHPTEAQVTQTTRELAMLLGAGMPLAEALRHLESNTRRPTVAALIGRIRVRINDGQSLHAALEPEAQLFPPGYRSMVRVAEESGTLPLVLDRIGHAREQSEKLRASVRSALVYPAFLIATAIGAVLVMLLVVVPRFKQLLASVDPDGGGAMAAMIALSDWIAGNATTLLMAGLAGLVLLVLLVNRPGFRAMVYAVALRVPVLGDVLRTRLSAVFCRALATLLENGVQLDRALELTADVLGHGAPARAVRAAHDDLRSGRPFVAPLEASGQFMPVVTELLSVSLASGTLAETTGTLADRLETDLELRLRRLFTILEPAIIILVSIFVAAVIMSILNAVLSVNDLVL